MTNEEFIASIKQTFLDGVKIVQAKNADYANNADPFKNFRFAELVGVDPRRGILIRMTDKLARVSNLLDKEAAVKDEAIQDTLLDLINYTAILKAFLEEGKNNGQEKG
jgi:hypothetical protein